MKVCDKYIEYMCHYCNVYVCVYSNATRIYICNNNILVRNSTGKLVAIFAYHLFNALISCIRIITQNFTYFKLLYVL